MSDPRWTVDEDGRLNITLPSTDVILCGPDAVGYMPVDWYAALVECVRSHDTLTRARELAATARQAGSASDDFDYLVSYLLDLLTGERQ